MPSPLNLTLTDSYFALLSAHLSPMPEAVREEHLRELRQHLEALISARQAEGASEDEAVSHALAQMGDPAQIGRKLSHEWKRTTQRQFWRTVIGVGVGQGLIIIIVDALWMFWKQTGHYPLQGITAANWSLIMYGYIPIIAGVIVGRLLPERAVSAACIAGIISCALIQPFCLSFYFYTVMHNEHWKWQWELPDVGFSGYGVLAAYLVSSMKRKDWKVQVS